MPHAPVGAKKGIKKRLSGPNGNEERNENCTSSFFTYTLEAYG
jgi:hypothetical protein